MPEVKWKIRGVAEAQGLNIEHLSQRAGIAYNTAKAIWYGSSRRIDTQTLAKICRALDAQPGDLLEYKELETPVLAKEK